jgi:uncharacterized protein
MMEVTGELKRALLKLARKSIEKNLGIAGDDFEPAGLPELKLERGAFVSLHCGPQLRGCIGRFEAAPLDEMIPEMALAAAFEDPRFTPLAAGELPDVEIEISLLTPMERIHDPEIIMVGKHGIYLKNGGYRGVLLPQVATEYGWDRETFLDHTCHKANLPMGAWKDPATEIYVFSADIFGDKDFQV